MASSNRLEYYKQFIERVGLQLTALHTQIEANGHNKLGGFEERVEEQVRSELAHIQEDIGRVLGQVNPPK